jgi:flagellar biosynthetic protein FliO
MFQKFVFGVFTLFLMLQGPLAAEAKKQDTPITNKSVEKLAPSTDMPLKLDQDLLAPEQKQIDLTEKDLNARPKVPSYEGAFVKMLIVLLVLLFVIFFVIWLMRRLTQHRIGLFNQTRHIKIIERRPLSPKTALYILEIGEKRIVVAESQLEVKALATFEEISSIEES